MSKSKTTVNKSIDGREDNRGNWEGSLFQRGKDKIDEQCIKTD